MSFAKVIKVGGKLAAAIMLGADTVEALQGTVKGSAKRDIAFDYGRRSLGFCSENQQIPMTPKIREKLDALNDAYVDLQNAIAEATGETS